MIHPDNVEVVTSIKKSRFKQYEIAEQMGVHQSTLSIQLRKKLSTEYQDKILQAIKELKKSYED